MSVRFIHTVVHNCKLLVFIVVQFPIVRELYGKYARIYLSTFDTFGFRYGTILNEAAMNVLVHVFGGHTC